MEYNDDGDLVPINGVAAVVFMPKEATHGGRKGRIGRIQKHARGKWQNLADKNARREERAESGDTQTRGGKMAEFGRMKTHGGKMEESGGYKNMRRDKMDDAVGFGKSNNRLKNRAAL